MSNLPPVESVTFEHGRRLEAEINKIDAALTGSAYCAATIQAAIDAGLVKARLDEMGFQEALALSLELSNFYRELLTIPKALSLPRRIAAWATGKRRRR